MVVFSRNKVFEISQLIEEVTGQNCAVIYGDLPPGILIMPPCEFCPLYMCIAVRVKQADMFNDLSSDCNIMVATDAIGMGLNL